MRRQLATIAAIAGFMAGSVAHAQTSGQSTGCPGMNGAKASDKSATFDDGSIVTVLERRDGTLRYEAVSPGQAKSSTLSY